MLRRAASLLAVLSVGCPAAPPPIAKATPPVAKADAGPRQGTIRYRLLDEVDTHDPEAKGPAKSSVPVTADARVRKVGGATIVGLTWNLPEGWTWVTPPQLFAVRDGAVWVLDGAFVDPGLAWESDDAAVAKALGGPPLVQGVGAEAQCGDRPAEDGPYGPVVVGACFDAHGLTAFREQNGHGPRLLRIVREE